MWTKIQRDEQSKQLVIGTIVIEYPVTGAPTDSIDFNDRKNLNSYQVVLLNPLTGEIDLSIPVMETSDATLLSNTAGVEAIVENPPVIHKYFEDLKEEGIWWIEE